MSTMAGEIASRMREDGIDPNQRFAPGESDGPVPSGDVPPTATPDRPGASAPGSEGGASRTPPAPATPAGAENADTVVGNDPGPVPYARFKEVNDRYASLRGFEELTQYGYDPDSLGRLAAFEASYIQDPTGTIQSMVDTLDLPPEAKASVREALSLSASADDATGLGGASGDDGGDSSGLSPEDRELLSWARDRRDREEQDAREAQLDSVVNAWKQKDTEEKVRTPPEHRQLAFISAAAARGGFRNLNELAEMARSDYMGEREEILGDAVQGSRRQGTPPPALPGSDALPAPAQRPRTLREASKLALAAMERGELPPVNPGG